MSDPVADIIRTPYKLGGRVVGESIDCLGAVQHVCRARGLPVPDGWSEIRRQWLSGGSIDYANGFPDGWSRVHGLAKIDGDILLTRESGHPGCAIVHDGLIVTAHPEVGAGIATPLYRWRGQVIEHWRFLSNDQRIRPNGPSRREGSAPTAD